MKKDENQDRIEYEKKIILKKRIPNKCFNRTAPFVTICAIALCAQIAPSPAGAKIQVKLMLARPGTVKDHALHFSRIMLYTSWT